MNIIYTNNIFDLKDSCLSLFRQTDNDTLLSARQLNSRIKSIAEQVFYERFYNQIENDVLLKELNSKENGDLFALLNLQNQYQQAQNQYQQAKKDFLQKIENLKKTIREPIKISSQPDFVIPTSSVDFDLIELEKLNKIKGHSNFELWLVKAYTKLLEKNSSIIKYLEMPEVLEIIDDILGPSPFDEKKYQESTINIAYQTLNFLKLIKSIEKNDYLKKLIDHYKNKGFDYDENNESYHEFDNHKLKINAKSKKKYYLAKKSEAMIYQLFGGREEFRKNSIKVEGLGEIDRDLPALITAFNLVDKSQQIHNYIFYGCDKEDKYKFFIFKLGNAFKLKDGDTQTKMPKYIGLYQKSKHSHKWSYTFEGWYGHRVVNQRKGGFLKGSESEEIYYNLKSVLTHDLESQPLDLKLPGSFTFKSRNVTVCDNIILDKNHEIVSNDPCTVDLTQFYDNLLSDFIKRESERK